MTSIKDNTIFNKTSFLEGSNSSFIEELYLKYINNPENVPQSWKEFFDGLDEDQQIIQTETCKNLYTCTHSSKGSTLELIPQSDPVLRTVE